MFAVCYFKQSFITNQTCPDVTSVMIWSILDYVRWQNWRNFVDVKVPNLLTLSINRKTVLGGPALIRWVLTRSLRDYPVGLEEVSYRVVRRPHWLRPKGALLGWEPPSSCKPAIKKLGPGLYNHKKLNFSRKNNCFSSRISDLLVCLLKIFNFKFLSICSMRTKQVIGTINKCFALLFWYIIKRNLRHSEAFFALSTVWFCNHIKWP